MTKETLFDFIKQNKFAVLSTISKDNQPQSACVGIAVTPELRLIFDTRTDSRKYENLKTSPRVSVVIGWENGQTIQYEGRAFNFGKHEHPELLATYFETFPDGLDRRDNGNTMTYFVVEPAWIRFSDYRLTPPQIDVLSF